jgi:drug/metabolite transporter (DMT)-like permease
MGGALIVAWTDGAEGSDPLWGNFLALLGSWAAAGYLMAGRRLRARVSLLGYVSVTYAGAALWLLLAISLQRHSLLGHSTAAYGWCLALAVVPQLIGHSIFNWSLRYLPATTVAVLVLGEPVGAILLNLALLGQPPTEQEMVGGAVILIGVGLASRGR